MNGIIGVSPDMRSGLVGAWPSGHVIQTHRASNTGQYTTSATNGIAYAVYPVQLSFKLRSRNPMIIAHYKCCSGTTNDTVSWKLDFGYSINSGSFTMVSGSADGLHYEYHVELGDGDIRRGKNIAGSKIITAGAGSEILVKVFCWGGHSKATSFQFNHDLSVMEIQQ
jgi:hypothetical protein